MSSYSEFTQTLECIWYSMDFSDFRLPSYGSVSGLMEQNSMGLTEDSPRNSETNRKSAHGGPKGLLNILWTLSCVWLKNLNSEMYEPRNREFYTKAEKSELDVGSSKSGQTRSDRPSVVTWRKILTPETSTCTHPTILRRKRELLA